MDMVSLSQNQHILVAVQHLIVVRGRLFPLYPVPHNLNSCLHLQTGKGSVHIPFPQCFIRHGNAYFKEAMVFNDTPVAYVAVWGMHADNVLGMLNQALIKRLHYLVCQRLAVLKIPDGLDPKLPSETSLQDSPCGIFRLRRQRLCADPVHKQVHKRSGVLLVPGHLVSLT